MMHVLPWFAGIVACAIAAWHDLSTRKVPNWLTLPLMGAAPILVLGTGWRASVIACVIVVCALFIGAQLHAIGLLGGGDLKLLAGVAPLCGYPACINMLLYTAIAGGLLAAVIAVARREHSVFKSVFSHAAVSISTGRLGTAVATQSDARMPYALAILIGFSVAALAQSAAPFLRILR